MYNLLSNISFNNEDFLVIHIVLFPKKKDTNLEIVKRVLAEFTD